MNNSLKDKLNNDLIKIIQEYNLTKKQFDFKSINKKTECIKTFLQFNNIRKNSKIYHFDRDFWYINSH